LIASWASHFVFRHSPSVTALDDLLSAATKLIRYPMRIELNCAECGRNRFSLDKDVHDSSMIRCEDCGHEIGTMEDLKKMVAVEVLKRTSAQKH
jgi:DNA-directed RNA polymerase subunit RPC12/RpoP